MNNQNNKIILNSGELSCTKVIDLFAQQVHYPSHQRNVIPKDFFAQRIVNKNNAHLKCFASECLTTLPILVLFCDLVLEKANIMAEHIECLKLLALIVAILFGPQPESMWIP